MVLHIYACLLLSFLRCCSHEYWFSNCVIYYANVTIYSLIQWKDIIYSYGHDNCIVQINCADDFWLQTCLPYASMPFNYKQLSKDIETQC